MNETASQHPHGKHGEEDVDSFDDMIWFKNSEIVHDLAEIKYIQWTKEAEIWNKNKSNKN